MQTAEHRAASTSADSSGILQALLRPSGLIAVPAVHKPGWVGE